MGISGRLVSVVSGNGTEQMMLDDVAGVGAPGCIGLKIAVGVGKDKYAPLLWGPVLI